MSRILVVEHDPVARSRLRGGLEGAHEVVETGDVRYALALALHDRPDAIVLDLELPDWTGFELCQALALLSFTRLIPVFLMTKESAEKLKAFCQNLCAVDYFEKPVDLEALGNRLAAVLATVRPERRSEVRIWLRVILRLRGTDTAGTKFDLLTTTEDVSVTGFLCRCAPSIPKGAIVEVSLVNGGENPVGQAEAIRGEWHSGLIPHYGFRFTHTPLVWVLQ
jgi:DNA-binding response OmpR family regulator